MQSTTATNFTIRSYAVASARKSPAQTFGPLVSGWRVGHHGSRAACKPRASDVTQSFLDLTNLVAPATSNKGAFEDLAYTIGREAYADLSGWHLFLKDMTAYPGGPKMNTIVAEQLGTQVLASGNCNESDVVDLLKKIPVKLGQGKVTVSLDEVLPSMCVRDIVQAGEDFQRRS